MFAAQVADRGHRIFDANYLSLTQLDALLVVVKLDGKDVYLDPGEKLCTFGQLAWMHAQAGGLWEDAKFPIYTPRIAARDALTSRDADLKLSPDGAISGRISYR